MTALDICFLLLLCGFFGLCFVCILLTKKLEITMKLVLVYGNQIKSIQNNEITTLNIFELHRQRMNKIEGATHEPADDADWWKQ